MITVLYILWFTLPVIFLIMALWYQLELWSGHGKKGDARTYLKQGLFVLVCAIVSVIIEQNFLEDLVNSLLDPLISLQLAQIILFPIVLFIAATITGGSRPVQLQSNRINKAKRKRK